jgi:hypothetical protein
MMAGTRKHSKMLPTMLQQILKANQSKIFATGSIKTSSLTEQSAWQEALCIKQPRMVELE